MSSDDKALFTQAKALEWNSWLAKDVIGVMNLPAKSIDPERIIQSRLLTWKKVTDDGTNPESVVRNGQTVKAKARLVLLGYQDPEIATLRTDSPTASQWMRRQRSSAVTPGEKKWEKRHVTTSTTRHQPRAETGELFIQLPPDVNESIGLQLYEHTILKKAAYGLCDAPRRWFRKICKSLGQIGFIQSTHDPCLWYLLDPDSTNADTQLVGAVAVHVDDFLCGGYGQVWDEHFAALKRTFTFSEPETGSFLFTGVRIIQESDRILFDQSAYAANLSKLHIPRDAHDEDQVEAKSMRLIKQALGELQWLATQSRPDISAEVSPTSSLANNATAAGVKRLNKLIRRTQASDVCIVVRKLPAALKELQWVVTVDAAFAVRDKGYSQAGHLLFLTTPQIAEAKEAPVSLLDWSSSKIDRVVRSSFAAEAQAAIGALEHLEGMQFKWDEMLYQSEPRSFRTTGPCHRSHIVTDCKGLYSHLTTDQSLKASSRTGSILDILILKQIMDSTAVIWHWVNNEHMCADAMTKAQNARHDLLNQVLRSQRYRIRLISYSYVSGRRERAAKAMEHMIKDIGDE
eukprot:6492390-Amphidinium_carterae.2